LKLTIQWKVLDPVGYIELVIIVEYEYLFTNEVQTLKLMNLRISRPISELGKHMLKSDLKSTINLVEE
jgi:hypothetical protein